VVYLNTKNPNLETSILVGLGMENVGIF
jgi:hypothetical protein